jgi:REP element-mobilizing transposase RayT
MPVYLITCHSYRSWDADNPRGYVSKGRILPPDAEKAKQWSNRATHDRVRFTKDLHQIIINGCRDICQRREWRLHHVVVVSSHMHALVGWRDQTVSWKVIRDTIKRLLGWMLAKHTQQEGRKWFGRKGSRKRIRDRSHFTYHMTKYLPDHSQGRRGGSGWCEVSGCYGKAFERDPARKGH